MKLILDTNIYRNLVFKLQVNEVEPLVTKMLTAAKERDVQFLFPIPSAMELIAHYNDENEAEKAECRKSLELLVNLSSTIENGEGKGAFSGTLNSVLEKYFSGKVGKYNDMYNAVINVSLQLVGILPVQEGIDDFINTVIKQIEFEKDEIKHNYEGYLKSVNEQTINWSFYKKNKEKRDEYFKALHSGEHSFLVTTSMVKRAYEMNDEQLDLEDNNTIPAVQHLINDFCPAIVMNEQLLEKVGHGVEKLQSIKDARWNTIMDISLIFGALDRSNEEKRVLVTEETNIQNSFSACGFADKVMGLNDMQKLLGL